MSIEDKENDVAVIVTKESTSVRGSGSPGGDKTTPDKRSNNNINNEASPFTQAMLADIAIDENGNITVLGSQTPLKEVTQQKQQIKKDETHHSQQQQRQQPTHSLKRPYEEEEEEEGSTKGGNSSNASLSVDSESLAHKKVHLSKWVDFSTSLEEDYMQTLFQTESAKCVQHGFISRQPEVTADMRATLVDWMGDVANWVPLNEETLFLAVNYVDRYLSVRGVRKANLQLLGIAALHTAGKYEEVDPASCSMLAPLAGKRETCKRVNTMELKIGVALDFDYNVATHMAFLRGLTLFDESHISISSGVFTNALVKQ